MLAISAAKEGPSTATKSGATNVTASASFRSHAYAPITGAGEVNAAKDGVEGPLAGCEKTTLAQP